MGEYDFCCYISFITFVLLHIYEDKTNGNYFEIITLFATPDS